MSRRLRVRAVMRVIVIAGACCLGALVALVGSAQHAQAATHPHPSSAPINARLIITTLPAYITGIPGIPGHEQHRYHDPFHSPGITPRWSGYRLESSHQGKPGTPSADGMAPGVAVSRGVGSGHAVPGPIRYQLSGHCPGPLIGGLSWMLPVSSLLPCGKPAWQFGTVWSGSTLALPMTPTIGDSNQVSQFASPGARAPRLASPAARASLIHPRSPHMSSAISRLRRHTAPSLVTRVIPSAQWIGPGTDGTAIPDGWPDHPPSPAPVDLPFIPAQEPMPGTMLNLGVSWTTSGWGTDSPIAIPILAAVGLIPCAVRQRQPCLRLVGFDPSVPAPSG
jgi:hypothetical protein